MASNKKEEVNMIVKIEMKTPDALDYAIKEAIGFEFSSDDDQYQELYEKLSKKFFKYGEYCEIEVDTETMKAEVVPCG